MTHHERHDLPAMPATDAVLLREPPHAEDHAAIANLWRLLLPAAPPPGELILALMPCEDGRPTSKVLLVVDDVPADPTVDDMRMLGASVAHIVDHLPGGGVLAALVRQGTVQVTERDVRWVEPVAAACAARGVPLLGLWLRVADQRAVRLDAPPRPRPADGL